MTTQVSGDLYVELDGKLVEIKRQMRQSGGYPFDPEKLNKFLQRAVEGRFDDTQRWGEKEGVIYFKVTSNGMTGLQWIEHFKKKGIELSETAKHVLLSPAFKPTNGVTTEVVVLKGILFMDHNRITYNISTKADELKLVRPEVELAYLIRDMFTNEEIEAMGIVWIVVFHEPIKDSNGDPMWLGALRREDVPCLDAYCVKPGHMWHRDSGVGFAVRK